MRPRLTCIQVMAIANCGDKKELPMNQSTPPPSSLTQDGGHVLVQPALVPFSSLMVFFKVKIIRFESSWTCISYAEQELRQLYNHRKRQRLKMLSTDLENHHQRRYVTVVSMTFLFYITLLCPKMVSWNGGLKWALDSSTLDLTWNNEYEVTAIWGSM